MQNTPCSEHFWKCYSTRSSRSSRRSRSRSSRSSGSSRRRSSCCCCCGCCGCCRPRDVEQPKHLLVYDLGLGDTDQAYHSPLMAIANMRAIKNFRIRSQAAESQRRGRWQEKNLEYLQARQDREEIRQERQDSAPPLRRDNFRTTESSQQNTERSESRSRGRDHSTPGRPRTPTPTRVSNPARG